MDGSRQRVAAPGCRTEIADTGGECEGSATAWLDAVDGQQRCKQQLARIANTIEAQVVPRLVLAHRAAATPSQASPRTARIETKDVARFAQLVLRNDIGAVLAYIEERRAAGTALEALYLDLLAPAARHLGELWEADLCDFTQVTIGLWRLQQAVRELSPAFQTEGEQPDHGRRALLVPVFGEQHTFGLLMVADFFRRDGWDVWAGAPASSSELLAIVRSEWFAVIGLSVSCEQHLEGLAAEIHGLRRASRNRAVGIMVGGPVFLDRPELAALVGADATALNGRQACQQAESLIKLLARPS